MNPNSAGTGLLTNQPNTKYAPAPTDDYQIELPDVNDGPQYISMDEKESKPQTLPLYDVNPQAPTQMLGSKNQNQTQNKSQNIPQNQYQPEQLPQQQFSPYQQQCQYRYQQYQYDQFGISQTFDWISGQVNNTINQVAISTSSRPQSIACCLNCKTTQCIADANSPFMCFSCKQVTKPQYQYFQCGICKVKVMYQTGISNIIRCTQCQTSNYVQMPSDQMKSNSQQPQQQQQQSQQQSQQQQKYPQQQQQQQPQQQQYPQQQPQVPQQTSQYNALIKTKIEPIL